MDEGHDTLVDAPALPADDLRDEAEGLLGVDVGGYVIDGELGRGGMGVVFSATHPVIGKRAAIKVLKPSLSRNPATVNRFIQEARSVNQIGHPNIVDIFAFGRLPDGRAYLVMDLLEGESLRKRVRRGALAVGDALLVIDEIASALAATHDKGFIHRDLKPDNVFLVAHPARTECMLLDFGLAKLMPNAVGERAFRTATGAQLGTPDYMSPEQLQGGRPVDTRIDIYALGVMAFEILVGERPRRYSDGMIELDGMTIGEALVTRTSAPHELAQLVEAMLAHDPDRRPSLAAIRAVVQRARTARPVASPVLRPSGSSVQSTRLGVAPPGARPSRPSNRLPAARPSKPQPVVAHGVPDERAEPVVSGKTWVIVALLLVVASAAAAVVVLVQ